MSPPSWPSRSLISYTCAYWDHLHGSGPFPCAAAHGLTASIAGVLRRQCDIEFAAKKLSLHRVLNK